MSEIEHRAGTIRISAERLACTKAICNYIHDTYGRFPASTDALVCCRVAAARAPRQRLHPC
jgi:hypothetical protein